ncbi:MAG: autotransporter domain-containing protein [Methylacidiphilales bacterium]|nr:autotransporter domain-containing protein [Candidatus Methylacidiphilales bacterium]
MAGTVVQNTGSTVTTGGTFTIGLDGGTGNYTVNTGATLDIGTTTTPLSSTYLTVVGSGTGSAGTLNISGGTMNAMNPGTDFQIGAGGGTGTVNQSGTSTVNLGQSGTPNTIEIGTAGGTGTYNLMSGALTITDEVVSVGTDSGSTGTLAQTGGTLSVDSTSTFTVGGAGTGTYSLSSTNSASSTPNASTTADFASGITIGGQTAGGSGTVMQTGGTLTAEGLVTIGGATGTGTGLYSLSGASTDSDPVSAIFNAGVFVDATGSVNQTGGILLIPSGQTLDLSTVGSSYTLGGSGILQIADGALVGTSGEGTLNFAGGTLQIIGTTAGFYTDPLDGTMTGTSTIDAATLPGISNVTLSGNLSGTGGITFNGTAGTTVFNLTGNDTYTGATTINSGTLNLQPNLAGVISSSALNIGATGILNLNLNAGGLAYAGSIGGTGALNVNFQNSGDPFVVLNTSSYTGPITLGANGTQGTLQVYSGSYGNISDNGTGSSVVIGGTPLAAFPGGTAIPSSGVVTFGNVTYTGSTTINSGFTLNANTLPGSVTNNGSLFAMGTGALTNTGLLALPSSSAIGSNFLVNGSLNSSGPNAVMDIRVNGTTSDSFTADSATLSGVIKVVGSGTNTYTIVDAAGGITIGGDGLVNDAGGLIATTTSGGLFAATLQPDPFSGGGTTLQLVTSQQTIQQAVAAGTVPALTLNQNAVAGSIDPVIATGTPYPAAFTPVLNALNLLPGSQIPGALDELSPESLQYARMICFENSTFLAQRMNGVDADLRAGYGGLDTNAISVITPGFDSGLGRSLGSLLASDDPSFHQPAPNGVNYYPGGGSGGPGGPSPSSTSSSSEPAWSSSTQVISDSPNPYMANQNPSGPETPRFSEFIGGDVVLANLNQNQSTPNSPSSKASYTAADATAGVSFRMTSNLAAGVLFDYNHTSAKTDSSGSHTDVDSYSPGLFATYFTHGFYVNGLFSFGFNNYSNSRNIGFLGQTASSSPNGQQYVGDLDFGYDFHPNKNWIVGPTLGLTYTHLNIDSFSESGAPGANLNVDSQSADSLRSRLGGHVVFQTNAGDILLQPNLTAMWQHEYLDSGSGITSSFNDFSASPFTIQTASPSRDSALIGCGLTATLNNSMAFYLNYMADVGAGDYWAQSVIGGFKARF